jgi:single-strand DNA-binding protein
MNYELTGSIIEIYKEQQVSDRFKKREFVVEVPSGNFSEQIKFQLTQDKTDLIDQFRMGEQVKVHFNIRGSKWKDAYFVNLQAWRLEKIGAAAPGKSAAGVPEYSVNDIPPEVPENSGFQSFSANDDMPF